MTSGCVRDMTMSTSPTDSASRIPVTLQRASSLRLKGERYHHRTHHQDLFAAITENATDSSSCCNETTPRKPLPLKRSSSSASLRGLRGNSSVYNDGDADSVRSFGSNCSSNCDHAHFGLNGTTWSARSRRYIVHCSPTHSGNDSPSNEYLTPTQRAARQLRNVQAQLKETRAELQHRDQEIARLTKELVELRLRDVDKNEPDVKPTLDDSGHFEDQQQQQQQLQLAKPHHVMNHCLDIADDASISSGSRVEHHLEAKIEEMERRHREETQLMKEAHHDKLEKLLNQLADMSSRYCQTHPALEQAEARSCRLETELEELRQKLQHTQALLTEQEERNKSVYLEMYNKGQEAAAKIQLQGQVDQAASSQKVTVAELLRQLTVTQAELENVKDESCSPQNLMALVCRGQSLLTLQEAVALWLLGARKAMYRRLLDSKNKEDALDPEITLQFLKSAIYYFLTDKENLEGHLNAIQSILGFTDSEKLAIDKIYRTAKK